MEIEKERRDRQQLNKDLIEKSETSQKKAPVAQSGKMKMKNKRKQKKIRERERKNNRKV